MSTSATLAISELKRVLALLASAPEDQLAHLRSIGCEGAVDELALELDDLLPSGGSAALSLKDEQRAKVEAVRSRLAAMSGAAHEDLWRPEALASRPEWVEVRRTAQKALTALRS